VWLEATKVASSQSVFAREREAAEKAERVACKMKQAEQATPKKTKTNKSPIKVKFDSFHLEQTYI
jgi:hypothetical protein